MLAYASYHKRGVSIKRNKPLICLPCCEIVASASNLLVTVAGSISTPSLSDVGKLGKLLPFPPDHVGFMEITLHLSRYRYRRNGLPASLQADIGYYGSSVTMQGDCPLFRLSRRFSRLRCDVLQASRSPLMSLVSGICPHRWIESSSPCTALDAGPNVSSSLSLGSLL